MSIDDKKKVDKESMLLSFFTDTQEKVFTEESFERAKKRKTDMSIDHLMKPHPTLVPRTSEKAVFATCTLEISFEEFLKSRKGKEE